MKTPPPWKILAPVDVCLRDLGESAIRFALKFADATAGELTLLNVVHPAAYRDARETGWSPDCVLDPTLQRTMRSVVLPGCPVDVIGRYAAFIDASLILMTPRTDFRSRFRRESTTVEALRSIDRPVQIADVRELNTPDPLQLREILCVVHLEGNDGPALRFAGRLAARTGSRVTLLHVLPEVSEGLLAFGVAQPDRPLTPTAALNRIRSLERGVAPLHSTAIGSGPLHKAIRRAVRETRADLVVVSRPMGRV